MLIVEERSQDVSIKQKNYHLQRNLNNYLN